MNEDKRNRLTALGAETLAEALLDLAVRSEAAEDLVERLIATPEERVKQFKSKLAGLRRMRRFVGRGDSATFAQELRSLLDSLRTGIDDPRKGVELVEAFYESDDALFNHCDDSDGHIGDLFRYDARRLFVQYASRCEDKKWLADIVLKLNQKDAYGIRDTLINCAAEYLPEEVMRGLIDRLWELESQSTKGLPHWHFEIESLALQLRDAPLFEKARRAANPALSIASCTDISRAYLESGDAVTALSWLERIPSTETYMDDERDHLLMAIHEKTGNRGKLTETAWRIFYRRRSIDTLKALLEVIGADKKEKVVDDEVRQILQSEMLSYTDAEFLITAGRMKDAEQYILGRTDQLNGNLYTILLPWLKHSRKTGNSS
ncbi:MAG: DUF6880 family protein [Thermodesulfovibrionales bacterium]|jgi:hypothetical protein